MVPAMCAGGHAADSAKSPARKGCGGVRGAAAGAGGRTADLAKWPHVVPGIPDGMFERSGSVPITKEEARAVQLSKARLDEGATVYDIGCGSGSVSIEAALRVGPSGRVYAVDSDPEAVALTGRNLERFGIGNVEVVRGDARDVIRRLPEGAGAAIIGGTGGATAEIVRLCSEKLVRGAGRIVAGTVQVETLAAVVGALRGGPFEDIDVVQLIVAKGRQTSTGTMMLARNPVGIVSATRAAGEPSGSDRPGGAA